MASQAIGIDIGSHAVKIAVVQKKGGVSRAVRLFRATLGGDVDPVRIQGAVKRSAVTGGPALIGITGRDLIIRYTHVPPVPDWRLKLLMQFEINEVSGQSGGEVAADYRRLNLPIEADDDTVLVALARNTWLQPRLEAARGAALKAGGGCPSSVALFNAFLALGSWKDGESTFLVNIGRDNIDMAIQRDGELLFARNMSGGGQMFTEAIMSTFGLKEPKAEKNKVTKGDLTPKGQARYADSTSEKLANAMQGPAGQLVSMIQSSVMICRAQTKITDLNIDRLVLAGGTARMKGIREYFQANMSVPVEVFDPTTEMDVSALDPADQEELGESAADFGVAVGLAETLLAPSAFRLEVLTEKEKKKRHFLERTVWALGAAAAALALVVLLFNSRSDAIEQVKLANAQLDSTVKEKEDVVRRQEKAVARELDARRKEVALRVRRLPPAFARAVLGALYASHTSEYIHLLRFEQQCKKISLDLDGLPVGEGDARSGEDRELFLQRQEVWPEIEVVGEMKRDTPDRGGTLRSYYANLRSKVGGLEIEGYQVELQTEQLDSRNRFRMTFKPKAPAKKEEQS